VQLCQLAASKPIVRGEADRRKPQLRITLGLLDMNVCRLVALVAEKEETIARNPQDGRHTRKIRSDLGLSQLKTLRG